MDVFKFRLRFQNNFLRIFNIIQQFAAQKDMSVLVNNTTAIFFVYWMKMVSLGSSRKGKNSA